MTTSPQSRCTPALKVSPNSAQSCGRVHGQGLPLPDLRPLEGLPLQAGGRGYHPVSQSAWSLPHCFRNQHLAKKGPRGGQEAAKAPPSSSVGVGLDKGHQKADGQRGLLMTFQEVLLRRQLFTSERGESAHSLEQKAPCELSIL